MRSYLFASLYTAPALGQVSGGVKAGLTFSTFLRSSEVPEASLLAWRPDLTAGAFLVAPATGRVAGQFEVMFSRLGPRLDSNGERVDFQLSYLDVSGLVRVALGRDRSGPAYAIGGITIGRKLKAVLVRNTLPHESDLGDAIAGADVRVLVGAGAQHKRLVVEVRYTWGLRHFVINPSASDEAKTFRNRALELLVGVRF